MNHGTYVSVQWNHKVRLSLDVQMEEGFTEERQGGNVCTTFWQKNKVSVYTRGPAMILFGGNGCNYISSCHTVSLFLLNSAFDRLRTLVLFLMKNGY